MNSQINTKLTTNNNAYTFSQIAKNILVNKYLHNHYLETIQLIGLKDDV
jgi:hypothetical protein